MTTGRNDKPGTYDTEALRLAAPAPGSQGGDDLMPPMSEEQQDLDNLSERWVQWSASRRLYGPSPTMGSVLGQLTGTSTRSTRAGGPDAITSAELAAFHVAYTCQPDALDKRVFALYYVHRVKPIKAAAAALGVSTRHFYRLLEDFRLKVAIGAKSVMADNEAARAALPHAPPGAGN